jgi:hypothetical protein
MSDNTLMPSMCSDPAAEDTRFGEDVMYEQQGSILQNTNSTENFSD